MQRYEHSYEMNSDILYFTPDQAIFLDIETTGLKRSASIITVIGCSFHENGLIRTIQWFNDDGISEEDMLSDFLDFYVAHGGTILTFNGDSFDLPFLKAHLSYNGLSSSAFSNASSLDFYRMLRGYAALFHLEKSTQKSWERFLGIHREDQYSGKKLIEIYKSYLKSKSESDRDLILLHNREDIRYLTSLTLLFAYFQLTKGEFSITEINAGMDENQLTVDFLLRTELPLPRPISIANSSGVIGSVADEARLFHVILPVQDEQMYHFYSDYHNYYYIISEDRAIHKSIGSFVEKENRKKCNRENCYISADGIFLPLPAKKKSYGFQTNPDEIKLPVYQKTYDSIYRYVKLEDLFPENGTKSIAIHYLSNVIQEIFLREIRP